MWIVGLDWDDELSTELSQKSWQWFNDIPSLTTVRFPRCLSPRSDVEKRELHVFADASQEAYGAVVYSVNTYSNGEVSSILIASKSRVAPVKSVSIPRMELLAVVLGVKLLLAVTQALKAPITRSILWSDSMNVLFWIKSFSRNFKPFVGNRISFIQEHTDPSQWFHVPTGLNPADAVSTGAKTDLAKGSYLSC